MRSCSPPQFTICAREARGTSQYIPRHLRLFSQGCEGTANLADSLFPGHGRRVYCGGVPRIPRAQEISHSLRQGDDVTADEERLSMSARRVSRWLTSVSVTLGRRSYC